MTFDHPAILIAFLIFIPLIIYNIITSYKIKNLPEKLKKKILTSNILFNVFLALTITAAAGPRWGTGYAYSEYRRGLDIVFAVDVSRSMDIRDAQTGGASNETGGFQSRLERGLSIAGDTLLSVTGARFAVAVGRGTGYLAIPLTHDIEAAQAFFESFDGSSMTGRSTNLESLVESAADAFQSGSAARKVIVLISDGEAHAGVLRNAVNRCIRDGIILNTVAAGSDDGRLIQENPDNPGSPVVLSRRDAAVMRTASERNGVYIDANRGDASHALSAHLLSLAQETENPGSRSEQKQRRTLFVILAIIAYGASKFVTRNWRPALVSVLFISIFLSSCTEGKLLLLEANYLNSQGRYDEAQAAYVRALDHDAAAPYAEYGLGNVLHSLEDSTSALLRYDNSLKTIETSVGSEHRELRYRNFYNSGIIFFEDGDYHSAAISFRQALRLDPRRIDAKRNLELSLMSITMDAKIKNQGEGRQEQREILFDYLRQEEQQRWRSREWTPEDNFSGLDY